jgi:hypothetical protein
MSRSVEQLLDDDMFTVGKTLASAALAAASTLAVLAGARHSRAWSAAGLELNRWRSAARCSVCVLAVWAVVSVSWYSNGSFVSDDGERITFRQALGDLGSFLDAALACMSDPTLDYCKEWGLVPDSLKPDPYHVLGLPRGSSHADIKAKYKGLPVLCRVFRVRASDSVDSGIGRASPLRMALLF